MPGSRVAEPDAPDFGERRLGPDRRIGRDVLRFPERRTGFDRRSRHHPGRARASYERALVAFRDAPERLAAMLAAFVALNVADLLLTARALERGATEANPIMAGLLAVHPAAAAAFKLVAVGVATAVMWRLRRYRRILETSVVLVAAFGVLTLYHLVAAATVLR